MSASASSAAAVVNPESITRALSSLTSSLSSLATRLSLPRPPLLLAVSKFHPAPAIHAAYSHGQRHFGENYVVELVEKASGEELKECTDIKWSFIGHLQSNKCKALVKGVGEKLWQVECVDSKKLATELNKACVANSSVRSSPLRVLVQVNTSNEASKSGCTPQEVVELYKYILNECKMLKPSGLMTIGRLVSDGKPQRDCFELLAKCKDEVIKALGLKVRTATATNSTSEDEVDFELSMGMSGDYEVACEYGATEVRVGSTIFGARHDPKYAKMGEMDENHKEAIENETAEASSSTSAS